MVHQPEHQRRWSEAIEACRPGRDDLADPAFDGLREEMAQDPELEAAYRRVQSWDGRIGEAFRAVPVPPGLADAILGRIAEAGAPEAGDSGDSSPDGLEVSTPRKGRSRRRSLWLAGGGVLVAAAASLLIAVIVGTRTPGPASAPTVRQTALDRFDQDADRFGQGPLVTETGPPRGFPPSPEVRLPRARWRWVGDFLGRKAVAYDQPLPAGGRAILYVVKTPVTGLNASPPATPGGSGRRSVAAWKSGDLVYVLVLDQGPAMYRRLVLPPGPIT